MVETDITATISQFNNTSCYTNDNVCENLQY